MSSAYSTRRVLHIITGLDLGGAERILVNCAVAGRRRGYEPYVVALKSGGATRAALEANGIAVLELDASRSIPDAAAMRKLIAEAAKIKPAIVKSWLYHGNVFALGASLLSRHLPSDHLYWGIYNSALDLDQYNWRMSAVVSAGAKWSSRPQGIVYNSERAQRDHEAIGYQNRNTILINNGVDTLRFLPNSELRKAARRRLGIADDTRVAMIVARVDPQKDWKTVLDGVAQVPGLITIAVGPTTALLPDQPGLIKHGAHLEMEDLYPAADVFILPSAFGEGTSVAMSEAMACGIPVIVTDVGDNARYGAQAGRVIEAGSAAALAEALQSMLSDGAELAAASLRARLTAERYFGPNESFKHLYDSWDSFARVGARA